MQKNKFDILKHISFLPEHIINNQILSFYNPYKKLYNLVIIEISSKFLFNACIRQLKRYSIYDSNKNLISFQKYALLTEI